MDFLKMVGAVVVGNLVLAVIAKAATKVAAAVESKEDVKAPKAEKAPEAEKA